jgi:uncharacterized protein
MSRMLGATDVDDLAVGAWIVGTGGGGSPHLNHLNVQRLAAAGTTFELIDPSELDDEAAVAVVSTMGAPVVMQERLQDSRDVARAVEIMADYVGRPFDAIMATEIGGSNAFQPLMAAAHLNIPIVDADAMGRAYPEAQMTSCHWWPTALAACLGRPARGRGGDFSCANVEVDGASQSGPDGRNGLDGRHL